MPRKSGQKSISAGRQSALDAAISIKEAQTHEPAPFGYKKDGTPRKRRPGPGLKHVKRKANGQPKDSPPKVQEPETKLPDIVTNIGEVANNTAETGKDLKILQKDLFKLGRKAVKRLNKLLDSSETKVLLQASSIATRSALLGLAKDTLDGGRGAEIHIHATGSATVVHTDKPPSAEPEQTPHERTGQPVMVPK